MGVNVAAHTRHVFLRSASPESRSDIIISPKNVLIGTVMLRDESICNVGGDFYFTVVYIQWSVLMAKIYLLTN